MIIIDLILDNAAYGLSISRSSTPVRWGKQLSSEARRARSGYLGWLMRRGGGAQCSSDILVVVSLSIIYR